MFVLTRKKKSKNCLTYKTAYKYYKEFQILKKRRSGFTNILLVKFESLNGI